MPQKKKLQVFISSTFTDLKQERQAAVEAILTAGHIPAGMELFTAGDESQMNVIKHWIDESDIYLLILGGRYGSIEPVTKKSYIHLEYEYAVEKGKPLFAVVIAESITEDRVKQFGTAVIETENSQKLRDFRAQVLSKLVKFWHDPRDIKLAILETLSEFERRPELVGWISGKDSVNGGALVGEFARLTKENSDLREQLLHRSSAGTYSGLTYEQMYELLSKTPLDTSLLPKTISETVQAVAEVFGSSVPNSLHLLWMTSGYLRKLRYVGDVSMVKLINRLMDLGLVDPQSNSTNYYHLSDSAKQFLVRFRLEHDTTKAEQYLVDNF
jgi:hypothetical protein